MYTHEWVMLSRKPALMVSYYTIVRPFDAHVWMFTLCSMVAEFVILIASQNAWSRATGKDNPRDYVFEGGLFERMRARFCVFSFYWQLALPAFAAMPSFSIHTVCFQTFSYR